MRALFALFLIAVLLSGCVGLQESKTHYIFPEHRFRIRKILSGVWRKAPDVANVLALNDPTTSVLYFDNPYTGGVIALQVLPRHYSSKATFMDEMRYIYRRMLSTPFVDMRSVKGSLYASFDEAIELSNAQGALRGEFYLRGKMGRRPTLRSRELALKHLNESLSFGGAQTGEELKEERKFRYDSLFSSRSVSYRGKVVVFLRKGKLYEFYYIDHVLIFDSGLRTFDTFVGSFEFISS